MKDLTIALLSYYQRCAKNKEGDMSTTVHLGGDDLFSHVLSIIYTFVFITQDMSVIQVILIVIVAYFGAMLSGFH